MSAITYGKRNKNPITTPLATPLGLFPSGLPSELFTTTKLNPLASPIKQTPTKPPTRKTKTPTKQTSTKTSVDKFDFPTGELSSLSRMLGDRHEPRDHEPVQPVRAATELRSDQNLDLLAGEDSVVVLWRNQKARDNQLPDVQT